MISRITIENLYSRAEEFTKRTSQQRFGGVIVRSPRLCDGSVEIDTGTARLAMSAGQIARLQERLPGEIRGHETDLPIHPDRIAMTTDDFNAYCALIEQKG